MVANPNSIGSLVRAHPEKFIAEELRDLKRRVRSLESVRSPVTLSPSDIASAFTPSTTLTTVVSLPITVPSGFTNASLVIAGSVTATRSGGAAGTLSIQTGVQSPAAASTSTARTDAYNFPASTVAATCAQVYIASMADLSNGDTFAVNLKVSTSSAAPWDLNSGTARLYAFITFLR